MKPETTEAKCVREPYGQNKPGDRLQSPCRDGATGPLAVARVAVWFQAWPCC